MQTVKVMCVRSCLIHYHEDCSGLVKGGFHGKSFIFLVKMNVWMVWNLYISWWYFLPYIAYWSPRYIFLYINLSRGWYFHIYYLSTKQSKTGCFIFYHSLKAAVMTKQTNNCAGSSWHLKMFLRLACNRVLMSFARAPSLKQLGFAYVLAATI